MNTSIFTGKVAVVTGASRGLGRALAIEFARNGATVFGTGRDANALQETARAVAQSDGVAESGGSFTAAILEMRDEPAVREFFASLSRLDFLLNNAGIARFGSVLETSTDDLREMLETNVVGAFVALREGARAMQKDDGGTIINIVSDAGTRGIGNMAAYVSSKHALLGLGRSAHLELAASSVRVCSFCPGPIQTDILGAGMMPPNAMAPASVAKLLVSIAATPRDVAIPEMLALPI